MQHHPDDEAGDDDEQQEEPERATRAAVVPEQGAKRARPDIVRTNELQPVEPLGVAEFAGAGPLVHAATIA